MYISPSSTIGLPLFPTLLVNETNNGTSPPTYDDDDPRKVLENWSSIIGIVTAIVGNIIIALALNVQRYAHIKLHKERARIRARVKQVKKRQRAAGSNTVESENPNGTTDSGGYGATESKPRRQVTPSSSNGQPHSEGEAREEDNLLPHSPRHNDGPKWSEEDDTENHPEMPSTYLKSPYWWLGQVLITIGEMGNFLAYGFAPASIVSPLGVVALISNCIIAPIVFKEKFRSRDGWGVVVAVAGAVTVVLSAKTQETKLGPHEVWDYITTTAFEVYLGVTCGLIILLMWASPRYGNRTILIDLGLVGLFGGYTALSTKGVSSMLSSTLLGAFTTPVTYMLIFILLSTAVLQVRYVNKALQRFDSTQVIPIQFVIFTLSVIIGSAVLYRDFERTTAEQALKFIGGCLLTFFGVFIITSGRDHTEEDESVASLSDDEDVEETINMSEQDTPRGSRRTSTATQQRSRRSSRVSFIDTINKPLSIGNESGVPSSRTPNTASKASTPASTGAVFASSDTSLPNPWEDALSSTPTPSRPQLGHHTVSMDSIAASSSAVSLTAPETPTVATNTPARASAPQIPGIHLPDDDNDNDTSNTTTSNRNPPFTPRTSISRPNSYHYSGSLFSPSPLSTTVDSLLRRREREQSPSSARRPSLAARRSRPSLRSSLFVSQEDLLNNAMAESEDLLESGAGPTTPGGGGGGNHLQYQIYEEENDDNNDDVDGDGGARLRPGLGGARSRSFRDRAKSVGNTIGDIFGTKKGSKRSSRSRTATTIMPVGDDGDGGEVAPTRSAPDDDRLYNRESG